MDHSVRSANVFVQNSGGVAFSLLVIAILSAIAGSEVEHAISDKHKWMLQQNITTIHLISSCHLDIGFADNVTAIINKYFDVFFPQAISVAESLRALGGEERLVFTTHSYLVSLYLDCPTNMGLHCPSKEDKTNFIDAVKQGDITWHAFPFNSQPEYLLKPLMVDVAVNLTHRLDDKFGRPHTITMSQRDVPGMTSSIIPVLVNAGVKAITVGVNAASMPPAVPTVFQWQHNVSSTRILAMWHPGGYGGSKGVALDSIVIVPGMSHALAFAIKTDNSGPPSSLEVTKNYATLKELFPGATILASDYDSFVLELMQHQDGLPIVSGEIGDTWIYGTASDPLKTQQFYAILKTWEQLIPSSAALYLEDARILNFSRLLIKSGEHTWGKDVDMFLNDWSNWDNVAFYSQLNTSNFQDIVKSWVEQRTWGIDYALEALANHPLLTEIQSQLQLLHFNGFISTDGYSLEKNLSTLFILPVKGGTISIQFDVATGSIVLFNDSRVSAGSLADYGHPLAQVVYQTYDNKSYDAFFSQYLYMTADWVYKDFGKFGMDESSLQLTSPSVKRLWSKFNKKSMEYSFLLQLMFNTSQLITDYGAPEELWLEVSVGNETALNMVLYIVNKTATRLPESLSFYFDPPLKDGAKMYITKLDSQVPIDSVIQNGSQHLHSSQSVSYTNPELTFVSDDTSLCCVGFPTPFPTPCATPVVDDGFSFNIFNNIWGTNYIMWYPYKNEDRSSKYRFTMDY